MICIITESRKPVGNTPHFLAPITTDQPKKKEVLADNKKKIKTKQPKKKLNQNKSTLRH